MQAKPYNVVVLLLTFNDYEDVEKSIQSVLNQNFDKNRIKVVAIDNFSDDGTYEKLLQFVISDKIAVYRLEKKYIKTRLMFHANLLLQYTSYKYITILNPGDVLYPNYIEKCCNLMDNSPDIDSKVLVCETDKFVNDVVEVNTKSLFKNSFIIDKTKNFMDFFVNGIGHKLQCFYHNGVIPNVLVDLPGVVDFTDAFKKALYLLNTNFIYTKDNLACISETIYDDPLDDLFYRYYFIIRFVIQRETINDNSTAFLEPLLNNNKIYEELSLLALSYAKEAIAENKLELAGKILLFGEMVNEEICELPEYIDLSRIISDLSIIL